MKGREGGNRSFQPMSRECGGRAGAGCSRSRWPDEKRKGGGFYLQGYGDL